MDSQLTEVWFGLCKLTTFSLSGFGSTQRGPTFRRQLLKP